MRVTLSLWPPHPVSPHLTEVQLNMCLQPFQLVSVVMLSNSLIHLNTQLFRLLQSFLENSIVQFTGGRVLYDLQTEIRELVNKLQWTLIADPLQEKWILCNALHGLE